MDRTQYVCPDCETVKSASSRRPGWCPACGENKYFDLLREDGTSAGRSSPPAW